MQRVTNCLLLKDNHVLLLQKPRRGWWAIPGGKMEPQETIKESVIREYYEETGLQLINPKLNGVYTFLMKKDEEVVSEWMMFTFVSNGADGTERVITEEGVLKWLPFEQVDGLPMAEGDRFIIKNAISSGQVMTGKFEYTEDFRLLTKKFD